MQTLSRASVHLLFLCSLPVLAATKIHTVVLGSVKKVPYLAADVAREDKTDEAGTLKVRPLLVDTKLKEWTTGEIHEVTERTFVVRRVLHVNDTLPGEKSAHWVWQPGPWLLVDRTSGRVSALHLPDFDASVSEVSWYRDYGAYCGVKPPSVAAVSSPTSGRSAVAKPLCRKSLANGHRTSASAPSAPLPCGSANQCASP